MSGLNRQQVSIVKLAFHLVKTGGSDIRVKINRGHPEQLLPCVPQALAGLTIHIEDYDSVVEQEKRIRGMIHESPKPFLALA